MLIDVDGFPEKKSHAFILAIQHVLAMFVACITVPLLVFSNSPYRDAAGNVLPYLTASGEPLLNSLIPPTLIAAGIGTIFYLLVTKMKSPMFLASSFAYIAPMAAAIALGADQAPVLNEAGVQIGVMANLWILPIGMGMVGVVYCLVALLIKLFGVNWLNKLLPPIVVGPVIMVIGLGLAGSAISNLTSASGSGQGYNLIAILCGVIAMGATAVAAHYGKGTIALVPFIIGMASGYVAAALFTAIGYYGAGNDYFHIVNFSSIVNTFSPIRFTSFLDYPKFVFLLGNSSAGLTGQDIGQAAALFIPVSLVTICEHIGDHENMSGILDRNLLEEPGLSRTLIGDGVATALSGALCGAANTTYGENVAVVGVTKVASTKVIFMAGCITILLGFLSPLMAVTMTIPACVTGGVSLILYGFIAASGVKLLLARHIDMGKTRNIFIASVILVTGIGGLVISFVVGNATISVTSTAMAMIMGILMNLLLREKKEEPKEGEAAE